MLQVHFFSVTSVEDGIEVVIYPECRNRWHSNERHEQMVQAREPKLEMSVAARHLDNSEEVAEEEDFECKLLLPKRYDSLRLFLSKGVE